MKIYKKPSRTINLEEHEPLKVINNGEFITIITKNGPLFEFSLSDSNYKREIRIDPGKITTLKHLKSSEIIAGFQNGELKKLDQNYEILTKIGNHEKSVLNLQLEEKSMILYSSSEDHSVCEWDLLLKQSKQLYRHQASVQVLSLNSKSKRLLSGCLNQVLIIYSLNSSSIEHQVQLAINPCNPISEYHSILGSHKGKILIFHDKNLFKNSKIPQKHHPLLNTLTFNETIAKICKKINFQISDHLSDRTRTGIISADRKFLVSFEGENLVNIWKKSKFCAIPNCKFCNKKLKISFPVLKFFGVALGSALVSLFYIKKKLLVKGFLKKIILRRSLRRFLKRIGWQGVASASVSLCITGIKGYLYAESLKKRSFRKLRRLITANLKLFTWSLSTGIAFAATSMLIWKKFKI